MKKLTALCIFCLCLTFTGCVNIENTTPLPSANTKTILTTESTTGSENITSEPTTPTTQSVTTSANLKEKYVIKFELKQTHLDFTQYTKDLLNTCSFELPVDKEFYDSVEIGQEILDEMRLGSLVMHGSYGSWNITVAEKHVVTEE